ncbi:MAG: serine hydrolase domain-containing protein [Rhizomicrobium sp.]
MEIGGTIEPGFETVREAFAAAQAQDDGGAQLCVYRGGTCVVDLWAGRDKLADRPFTERSLVILMSASKGVTATLAHVLADRGVLDLEAPVATYWPAFAANGKGAITLSHLLTHSSGLVNFDADCGFVVADMCDWDTCVRLLERMAPLWEPGTATAYHALTYGFLVGETIAARDRQAVRAGVRGRDRGAAGDRTVVRAAAKRGAPRGAAFPSRQGVGTWRS